MSEEFLKLIKSRFSIFISIFLVGILATVYVYSTKPVIYVAKGTFKYIEPDGVNKTTKIDTNGTITYESIEPGKEGLHIPSLIKNRDLKISLNTGNGVYTVLSESKNKNLPIKEVNEFLENLSEINYTFLTEKLNMTIIEEEVIRIKNLIDNPKKSFPFISHAEDLEMIDNRYLVILSGIILSFFFALTIIVLKDRVDEL
ncbi:MAG: hypothetical protein ACRCYT_08300 [Cetobacterium sp.]